MDKAKEWVMMHIMIPIYAIRLLRDDYREEFKEEEKDNALIR